MYCHTTEKSVAIAQSNEVSVIPINKEVDKKMIIGK
jgi:hypothetical protein